jgi:ubiquinol-cytochrome c reductase cytochrome b subunit
MENPARGPVRSWLRRAARDFKASLDPSLLSIPRFLGLLYGRIDRSLPIDGAWEKAMRRRLPSYVGWRHALGGITYLLFIVLVVTGVLLTLYYRPTAGEAYASTQYVTSEVPMGWLVRDLHVWGANLIVLAVLAHMARVLFAGAYKPPRESSWLIGLLLLGVVLAFGATGHLLPWDQWAYWTTSEVLFALGHVPFFGQPLAALLAGGEVLSDATLNRFFTLHAILLPWAAFTLLLLHFTVVRRWGPAPPQGVSEPDSEGVPFFPNHLLRSFIAAVAVLAVAISLAILYPRPVSAPADPLSVPGKLNSSWVVVDVSLALIRYIGHWGFVVFLLLGVAMALLPFADRGAEYRLRRRPLVLALGVLFFAGFLLAWAVGARQSYAPTSATIRPGAEVEALPASGTAAPNTEASAPAKTGTGDDTGGER